MSRHKSLVHLVPSEQERLVLPAWMDTVSAWRRKSEAPQVPWKPLPLSVSVGRGGSLGQAQTVLPATLFPNEIHENDKRIPLMALILL